MKISRLEFVTILAAAVFLAFTAGWFIRGNTGAQPVRVEVARTPGTLTAQLPVQPGESAAVPAGRINLNTADSAALQTLPGIGEKRAEDIIAYRNAHGPFRRVSDLTRVDGIGSGVLEQLREFVTVD